MARIRTVKPELARHELMYALEQELELPMRFAWAMLPTTCDRDGRFKWRPQSLKLDILPYDSIDFARVLDAWLTRGFVVRYACEGELYGYIPTWKKHQVVNNREKTSDIPPPEDADSTEDYRNQQGADACGTREPRVNDATADTLCKVQGEGKGREGKGREGEKEGKGKGKEKQPLSGKPDHGDDIRQVFQHWQTVMDHPQAKLDDKRTAYIRKPLKAGYTVEQCCQAIDGCAKTPHNMGQNDRDTVYDGLHIILKTDNIDRFIKTAQTVTAPQFADPVDEWLNGGGGDALEGEANHA